MGDISILKLSDANDREIMIEDLLKYNSFSLCSLDGYKNLIGIPNFGYLVNSEEHIEVKYIFDIFWDFFADKPIDTTYRILFKTSGPRDRCDYYFEAIKRKDCNECQSILLVLKKNEDSHPVQVKFIDLWRDRQIELPDGFGVIEIEDYYLNIDTKNYAHGSSLIELETYHIVNNFMSALAQGDFKMQKNS